MDTQTLLDALAAVLDHYVDKNGLLYFKNKIDVIYAKKTEIPTALSQLSNDANYQTAENVNATLASYAKKTDLPTKVSDLTNDSGFITEVPDEYITDNELAAKGYQTSSQVETAITNKGYQTSSQVEAIVNGKGYQTASQVQAMVNNAQHMKREIVSALPDPSAANELTIYLVANDKGSYDEYMLINGKMDKVGASDTDLTGYLNTTNFTPLSNEEIDTIFS